MSYLGSNPVVVRRAHVVLTKSGSIGNTSSYFLV
jgi:hypothetical protein